MADFLLACKSEGWYFTFNWFSKRLKELEKMQMGHASSYKGDKWVCAKCGKSPSQPQRPFLFEDKCLGDDKKFKEMLVGELIE